MTTTSFQPNMEVAAGTAPVVEHRLPAADGFALIRGAALKLARYGQLPHADAEDLAAELTTRELVEARSVGRPNTVRREHTRPAWIALEARNYRKRVLARRMTEATDPAELPELEAEDFAELDASPPVAMSPLGAYRDGLKLARRLEVPDHCAHALAQGLWSGDAVTLAAGLNIAPGTWRNRVSAGARIIREHYPDPSTLADVIERGIVRRTVPLERRTLGAALPADRHRNSAQLAREADVLIARPQRPGRAPTACELGGDWRADKAPDEWATTRRADVLVPPELLRRIARFLESRDMPRSGARPHRAARGVAPELSGMVPHPEPSKSPDGWAMISRPERPLQDRDTLEGWARPDSPLSRRSWRRARRYSAQALAKLEQTHQHQAPACPPDCQLRDRTHRHHPAPASSLASTARGE